MKENHLHSGGGGGGGGEVQVHEVALARVSGGLDAPVDGHASVTVSDTETRFAFVEVLIGANGGLDVVCDFALRNVFAGDPDV